MRDPIEEVLQVSVNKATDGQLTLLCIGYEAARTDPVKLKRTLEEEIDPDEEPLKFIKPKRQTKISKLIGDI